MTDSPTTDSPTTDSPTTDGARRAMPWLIGVIAVLVIALVVVLLVRRDDDVTTTAGSSTSSTTAVASTTSGAGPSSSTPSGIDTMPGAGTVPVSVPAPAIEPAQLTAVRVARQEGYDRVVFEFTGDTPGYDVRYVDKPVTEDPSGNPVALAGDHALSVRMTPASGVRFDPGGYTETYTGPKRIPGPGSEITEVVEAGDFEAQSTWVIGLRDKVDFRVSTLTSPTRIVVDVRNH